MIERWYEQDGTPDPGIAWWAVEHNGHPAFYLRAFMAGDFAPGCAPLPRHVLDLDGEEVETVRCGTCRQSVAGEDLLPIERSTGLSRFLDVYQTRRAPWPKPTDPGTCWECSTRKTAPSAEIDKSWGKVKVCPNCAAFDAARSRIRRGEEMSHGLD